MKAQGGGRIVSISMTLHYRGWPLMAHATAAKAGRGRADPHAGARVGARPDHGQRRGARARSRPRASRRPSRRPDARAPDLFRHGRVRRPGPFRSAGGARRRTSDRWSRSSRVRRRNGSPARSSWWTAAHGSPAGDPETCSWDTTAWRSRSSGRSPRSRSARCSSRSSWWTCCGARSSCSAGSTCGSCPDDNPLLKLQFYDYPITHSLVGRAGLGRWPRPRCYYSWPTRDTTRHWQAAALVGAAVASHWLLDLIVHVPDLPLAGNDSPKLGLGLWRHVGAERRARAAGAGRRPRRSTPAGASRRHPVRPVRLGCVLVLLLGDLCGVAARARRRRATTAIGAGRHRGSCSCWPRSPPGRTGAATPAELARPHPAR